MRYTCYKGCHWFLPVIPRFYWKRKKFNWLVSFDGSCKYDIQEEQLDWNKLVGVSNYLNPRKDSLRFVWRYNIPNDNFEIGIYVEKNKVFNSFTICSVKENEKLELELLLSSNSSMIMSANGISKIVDFKLNDFSIRTNPYFGGNMPSPHKMFLMLK
jgi:hypothetical protein